MPSLKSWEITKINKLKIIFFKVLQVKACWIKKKIVTNYLNVKVQDKILLLKTNEILKSAKQDLQWEVIFLNALCWIFFPAALFGLVPGLVKSYSQKSLRSNNQEASSEHEQFIPTFASVDNQNKGCCEDSNCQSNAKGKNSRGFFS